MGNDPDEVTDALRRAEDAFGGYARGRPAYEEGLDPDDATTTQLRKACRLLDACRTLREQDGYHTSVLEMSFAAVERTLEFYALEASNDGVGDFQNHEAAYDRASELGVFAQRTCDALYQLYRDNRSASYYRDTVATREQADATFELAVTVHDHVTEFAQRRHDCRCTTESR